MRIRLLLPIVAALAVALVAGCDVPTGNPDITVNGTPLLPSADPAWLTAFPAPATDTVPPAASPTPAAGKPLATLPPELTKARVVRVVDGDTIHVTIDGREYTLRYIGIDTPETVKPNTPVEWMGPQASAANEALVLDKTVYLEKDVSETDRYGRLLRYVFLADGTFVNAELVRQGYAQAITYPPDVKYQGLLRKMERQARDAGRGLWGPQPTATPAPD